MAAHPPAGDVPGCAEGWHGTPVYRQYHDFHGEGLYQCACCRTDLFGSSTTFESGTGLPRNWATISDLNVRQRDLLPSFMRRIEVLRARCDAHPRIYLRRRSATHGQALLHQSRHRPSMQGCIPTTAGISSWFEGRNPVPCSITLCC
ncbi:MAG: peptide-methionine (R)-S-oxide reductase [Methanomicrobiales archaeon]|nr:peptide-methionine (R)-S-oxide reductase [Methanomicrobiales archaeon]MDI6875157.1 peptide-methionine (R)-S-oxide reductase [Methanomicrobiales archaeon]